MMCQANKQAGRQISFMVGLTNTHPNYVSYELSKSENWMCVNGGLLQIWSLKHMYMHTYVYSSYIYA